MTRPTYLADEVPRMAAELVRLRRVAVAASAVLASKDSWDALLLNEDARNADFKAEGERFMATVEALRAALSPRPDDGERGAP